MESVERLKRQIHRISLKYLKEYGFCTADISRFECYTMEQLVSDFCEEVPTFFRNYRHLLLLFTHRFEQCNAAMHRLRSDLMAPPAGLVQHRMATVIHDHFLCLPWIQYRDTTVD